MKYLDDDMRFSSLELRKLNGESYIFRWGKGDEIAMLKEIDEIVRDPGYSFDSEDRSVVTETMVRSNSTYIKDDDFFGKFWM